MNALAPADAAGVVALARRIELAITERQAEQLESFAAMLKKWNRAFNLLSRRDIDRLWSRHILDALTISSLLAGGRVMDFGTGGGFPGLPLAVVNPDLQFVLLDRHQRKCRFLEQVVHTLQLSNTKVICGQAAEVAGSLGRFASNPELSFNWYDAAVLSQRIRQQPKRSAINRRFARPDSEDGGDLFPSTSESGSTW